MYQAVFEPVLLFNRFRIYEVAAALATTILFGVILNKWILSFFSLLLVLYGLPKLRSKWPFEKIYRIYLDHVSDLPIGAFTWGRLQKRSAERLRDDSGRRLK